MSSSAESGLCGLLAESLVCLDREAPGCYTRMCARMSGQALDLQIGDERMALIGDGQRLGLTRILTRTRTPTRAPEPAAAAPVQLRTERAIILAILDGELSLRDAVGDDRLAVRGPLDRLLILHAALADYLHGAVRSASFPALLQRLRSLHERETGSMQ